MYVFGHVFISVGLSFFMDALRYFWFMSLVCSLFLYFVHSSISYVFVYLVRSFPLSLALSLSLSPSLSLSLARSLSLSRSLFSSLVICLGVSLCLVLVICRFRDVCRSLVCACVISFVRYVVRYWFVMYFVMSLFRSLVISLVLYFCIVGWLSLVAIDVFICLVLSEFSYSSHIYLCCSLFRFFVISLCIEFSLSTPRRYLFLSFLIGSIVLSFFMYVVLSYFI